MQQKISNSQFFKSAGFIILSSLFLSLSAACGKKMMSFGELQTIVFLRFLVPFILLYAYTVLRRKSIKVASIKPHLLRCVFVMLAQFCLFYVLLHGNILSATLLYATSALFTPLLSRLVLKIKLNYKTLFSCVLGFIGVFITLGGPHAIAINLLGVGLLSGLFAAGSYMTLHHASKNDDAESITIFLFGACTLISFVFIILSGKINNSLHLFTQLNWHTTSLLLLFGIFTLSSQFFRSYGLKIVNKAASMGPFLYASIIFSGVIDWLWLGIRPGILTYLGIVVIIFAAAIMAKRS